jgi:hypothetical protein
MLNHWIKQRADLNELLPALSTYMGYASLTKAEQFLAYAPERFREDLRKLSPASGRRHRRDNPELLRSLTVIADNRLAEDAGWDEQILKIELQNLIIDNEVDVSLTGFEVAEIDLILGVEPTQDDEADQIPEGLVASVSKPGDVWLLGQHKVLCADVRDEPALAAFLQGEKADLVFTDPPYNVVIEPSVEIFLSIDGSNPPLLSIEIRTLRRAFRITRGERRSEYFEGESPRHH